MSKRFRILGVSLSLLLSLTACSGSEKNKALRVGFVPSENMQEVLKNAQPIVDKLHDALGVEVRPFVATDYAGVVEALRGNKLDIAFLNPAAYVLAKEEAHVKVLLKSVRRGGDAFYGAIITRTDSGINSLQDLKNHTFAFGDPISTSGHIFPKKMFKAAGIDPARDFKNVIFAGGHDATVLAVYNHKADAGATYANSTKGDDGAWTLYLKTAAEQAQIKVIAYTEPIPNDNLVASSQLDKVTTDKITKVFMDLSQSPEGRKWLNAIYRIEGFVPATDADYASVRDAFQDAGIPIQKAVTQKP
ncbi:MAG: phosphate/phosphite/phosphonate ABC transporter substrate-binding protein [Candidatus Sericytochromatia bacterium]|nr:phosphate/phosphite/phosphonate ABC transporter substrate-binding protein [Candidatus Sericytochromatia bacterium]